MRVSGGTDTLSLNPGKRWLWAVIWILRPFLFPWRLQPNLLNGVLCGIHSPSRSFRKYSTLMLLLGIKRWFLCLLFRSLVTTYRCVRNPSFLIYCKISRNRAPTIILGSITACRILKTWARFCERTCWEGIDSRRSVQHHILLVVNAL